MPTTRVVDLRRELVDLAIRHGKGTWPGVAAAFLLAETALPVCAPGYLEFGPGDDPLAALRHVRLIVNARFPNEWEEWARARGLAPPALAGAIELEGLEKHYRWPRAATALPSAGGLWSTTVWSEVRWWPRSVPAILRCGLLPLPAGGRAPTAVARRLERWLRALAAAT